MAPAKRRTAGEARGLVRQSATMSCHVVEQKECRNEVVGHICQDGKECQHEGCKAVRRWLEAVYVLLRESLGLAAGIRVSLHRSGSYGHVAN